MQSQYLEDLQTLLDYRIQVQTQAKQEIDKRFAPQYWAIGEKYADGIDISQNPQLAQHWLEKAAKYGNTDWWWKLGERYIYGKGVLKDILRGVDWLIEAANRGSSKQQWLLGQYYAQGDRI